MVYTFWDRFLLSVGRCKNTRHSSSFLLVFFKDINFCCSFVCYVFQVSTSPILLSITCTIPFNYFLSLHSCNSNYTFILLPNLVSYDVFHQPCTDVFHSSVLLIFLLSSLWVRCIVYLEISDFLNHLINFRLKLLILV